MTVSDIPALLRIQLECYPVALYEDEATMRARLHAAPDTAWVVENDSGVCAYLVAYRSLLGKVTPLGGGFAVPANPDTLYLHDLAVSRSVTFAGIGTALVRYACRCARAEGLRYSALVSVQGSEGFWRRQGYERWNELDAKQRAHLHTYPVPALYMVRKLS